MSEMSYASTQITEFLQYTENVVFFIPLAIRTVFVGMISDWNSIYLFMTNIVRTFLQHICVLPLASIIPPPCSVDIKPVTVKEVVWDRRS